MCEPYINPNELKIVRETDSVEDLIKSGVDIKSSILMTSENQNINIDYHINKPQESIDVEVKIKNMIFDDPDFCDDYNSECNFLRDRTWCDLFANSDSKGKTKELEIYDPDESLNPRIIKCDQCKELARLKNVTITTKLEDVAVVHNPVTQLSVDFKL